MSKNRTELLAGAARVAYIWNAMRNQERERLRRVDYSLGQELDSLLARVRTGEIEATDHPITCVCEPDCCYSEADPVVCEYCSTADPELPCPIADAETDHVRKAKP